jgi:hypothetical protein
MALPDFSKFKAPHRFVPERGGFRLYTRGEKTDTLYRSMPEAKKAVLSMNSAWRAKHGKSANSATIKNPRKYNESRDSAHYRKLSDLKKGEFFKRKADARKVYRKGDYDRADRKFACDDASDISGGAYLKGDTLVYVGFDY